MIGLLNISALFLAEYKLHVFVLLINGIGFRVMVFNSTFNNISVLLCRSVLFVEETGVSRENHIGLINASKI
jgi:hypothetical protein